MTSIGVIHSYKFISLKHYFYKPLLLLLIQWPLTAQVPNYVPQELLAAWYPFELSGSDVSGNNNDAILSDVIFTNDAFGNPSSSAFLNGTSTSFIKLEHNEQFDFGEVDVEFSIAMWVKIVENENSGDTSILFTKCEGIDNINPFPFRVILINQGDGSSELIWQSYNSNVLSNLSVTTIIPNDEYVHLVFSHFNNRGYIYVNGRFRVLQTTAITNRQNINEIYFGKRLDDPHTSFKGHVEQLGFWNRAINSCEVYSLFRRKNMLDYPNQIEQQNDGLYFTDATYYGYTFQWYECQEQQDSLILLQGEEDSHISLSEEGSYSLRINTAIGYTCVMQSDCVEFDPLLAANEEDEENMIFSLHPNPLSGILIIRFQEKVRLIGVKMYSADGKMVADESLAAGALSHTLDVSAFSKGVYSVMVYSENNVFIKKVVKH